jgi:hypothetical protein
VIADGGVVSGSGAGVEVGGGVVVGAAGTGAGVVDGFGLQPDSTASIRTDMTKKFHFIRVSKRWLGIDTALATKQSYSVLSI